ncbi:MAG: glycosyltransferase family 2 protein [Ardenticatenaceae bacterium]|nr:glycosyltransferase family 2 protein [Ardenticatenaceae bacterium]
MSVIVAEPPPRVVATTRPRPVDRDTLGLSLVLPVYQERDLIRTVITQAIEVLHETGLTFEVIAVDDGSTDGTQVVMQELAREFPDTLRVLHHPYNKGNGAALKTGIRVARGEAIACLDADGQHDPRDLLRMLPSLSDYDMVVGARTRSYQGARHRNLANAFFNSLASWLTDFPVEDLTSGYRVFRAAVIKQYIHLFPNRFSAPTTSTLAFIKGGHNVKYMPINAQPRRGSRSKIKVWSDGWRFLLIMVKIVVIFAPFRVFLPTALMLFLFGCALTFYDVWSLGRLHIPNASVVLFVVSVLVVLLGLIAEQIAALQVSVHDRVEG